MTAGDAPLPEHLIVDGLEGNIARTERQGGTLMDLDLAELPAGTAEGDVLLLQESGLHFEIDHAHTEERQQAAQATLDALNEGPVDAEISP